MQPVSALRHRELLLAKQGKLFKHSIITASDEADDRRKC